MKILKSIFAVFSGFIAVAVLSIVTDFALESAGFYPPQNKPELFTGGFLLIAFVYRSIYTIAGGYITARLAPEKPMKHAMILAVIGTAAATMGAAANWDKVVESTQWYPVSLAVTALPLIWLGAKLFELKKGMINNEWK